MSDYLWDRDDTQAVFDADDEQVRQLEDTLACLRFSSLAPIPREAAAPSPAPRSRWLLPAIAALSVAAATLLVWSWAPREEVETRLQNGVEPETANVASSVPVRVAESGDAPMTELAVARGSEPLPSTLGPDAIAEVTKGLTRRLDGCGQAHLNDERVEIQADIVLSGATGRARRVSVERPWRDTALGNCVDDVLMGAEFGRFASRTMKVRVPLRIDASTPARPDETVPEPPAGTVPEPPAGTVPEPPAGTVPEPPAGTAPEPPAGTVPEPPAPPDKPKKKTVRLPEKLTSAQVKKGMDPVRVQFKLCGVRAKQPPGSKGQVKFSIQGATGKAVGVHVLGSWRGTPLGRCVEKAARTARFPRFKKERMGVLFPIRL